nr:hypothetical protein [Jannaschia marina]
MIPVEESDIQTRATAAFATGDLPDVLNHTVQHLLPYAEAGLLDTPPRPKSSRISAWRVSRKTPCGWRCPTGRSFRCRATAGPS